MNVRNQYYRCYWLTRRPIYDFSPTVYTTILRSVFICVSVPVIILPVRTPFMTIESSNCPSVVAGHHCRGCGGFDDGFQSRMANGTDSCSIVEGSAAWLDKAIAYTGHASNTRPSASGGPRIAISMGDCKRRPTYR